MIVTWPIVYSVVLYVILEYAVNLVYRVRWWLYSRYSKCEGVCESGEGEGVCESGEGEGVCESGEGVCVVTCLSIKTSHINTWFYIYMLLNTCLIYR